MSGGGPLGCGCRGGGGKRRPRRGGELPAAPTATAAVAFSSDEPKRARGGVGNERCVAAVVSMVRGFGGWDEGRGYGYMARTGDSANPACPRANGRQRREK